GSTASRPFTTSSSQKILARMVSSRGGPPRRPCGEFPHGRQYAGSFSDAAAGEEWMGWEETATLREMLLSFYQTSRLPGSPGRRRGTQERRRPSRTPGPVLPFGTGAPADDRRL